jgi:probable rRNA maturation factor
VTFVDDSYIRELNNKYLKRDGPTDVLAFPIDDQESPQNGTDKILGDVYISLDRAKEQSIEYQVPFHQEVSRLMLHGLFHLLGYTHEEMSPLIERYLKVTDQTETE